MERLVTDMYTFKGKVEDCENDYIIAVQEKLRHYEDLAEQGRLIELPCPIGTTVYGIRTDCEGDYYDCCHDCDICRYRSRNIEVIAFQPEYFDEIGKCIFLTKEEAEQALKKETSIEKAKDELAEEIASLGLTDKADARDRIECVLKQMGE